jgi:hypothetical protein
MATNRIDTLDPALLRPGRIDRKVEFPNPTVASRMHIMTIHSRKMNLLRGINLKSVAEKMANASGAECKVIIRPQMYPCVYVCVLMSIIFWVGGVHGSRHVCSSRAEDSCHPGARWLFYQPGNVLSTRHVSTNTHFFTSVQEDFEMAVAKVMKKDLDSETSVQKLWK